MNIILPEALLFASYEELRLSVISNVMEKVYKDKRTSFGTVREEYRDDLYNDFRKHSDIKTLQKLNKIKVKDPIYTSFNKKYLKPNIALRMSIIKSEKALVIEVSKNIGEVKSIKDINIISFKDFEILYTTIINNIFTEFKVV